MEPPFADANKAYSNGDRPSEMKTGRPRMEDTLLWKAKEGSQERKSRYLLTTRLQDEPPATSCVRYVS